MAKLGSLNNEGIRGDHRKRKTNMTSTRWLSSVSFLFAVGLWASRSLAQLSEKLLAMRKQ